MKKKIFLSILSVALITILLIGTAVIIFVYKNRIATLKIQCAEEASYIALLIQNSNIDIDTIGKKSRNRITLIKHEGAVVYDSFFPLNQMDNYSNRPEVQEALVQGRGEAIRVSDDFQIQTYYYAFKLENGNIVCIASSLKNISGEFTEAAYWMIFLLCVIVLMIIITAHILTGSIIEPINNLNLDQPLANPSYDELLPLLRQIEKQNVKIKEQFTLLSQQQQEFNNIIDNMNEGLIIFSAARTVLFANKSAKELFHIQNEIGAGYLFVCRDEGYIRILESAFSGLAASVTLDRGGQDQGTGRGEMNRLYQLSANPVFDTSETNRYAAVLFAVDITEREKNEKIRREFTANVSHELKTPLTSIMGYAEIMGNGIARIEDMPHFAQQIYAEASRLLVMIEDIIRISQFDENTIQEAFDMIELHSLCETVLKELADKAAQKNVHFALEGQYCTIRGLKRTLHDLIYNLCDNAIIYNKPGGSILVTVLNTPKDTVLSVKDTGIGIAEEHQERIFERFYRIDKSRSKESGGTGLGLAIVKHAAHLHNAQINLKSELGIGTEIQIVFGKHSSS